MHKVLSTHYKTYVATRVHEVGVGGSYYNFLYALGLSGEAGRALP